MFVLGGKGLLRSQYFREVWIGCSFLGEYLSCRFAQYFQHLAGQDFSGNSDGLEILDDFTLQGFAAR